MKVQKLILFLLAVTSASAAEHPAYKSDYIGQEQRLIKSLSADDIQQLTSGKGWGLAKAAELNGMPGPIHVLQMKDKISLSVQQEQQINALYKDMREHAIPLGKQLVALEKDLNDAFARRDIDAARLQQKLDRIAEVHKQLRYVHLAAHLQTPSILSAEQIHLYNNLRGYNNGDPCSNIPQGHDAKMWKQHNGCK